MRVIVCVDKLNRKFAECIHMTQRIHWNEPMRNTPHTPHTSNQPTISQRMKKVCSLNCRRRHLFSSAPDLGETCAAQNSATNQTKSNKRQKQTTTVEIASNNRWTTTTTTKKVRMNEQQQRIQKKMKSGILWIAVWHKLRHRLDTNRNNNKYYVLLYHVVQAG